VTHPGCASQRCGRQRYWGECDGCQLGRGGRTFGVAGGWRTVALDHWHGHLGCEGVLGWVQRRVGCLILTSGKQWLAWRGWRWLLVGGLDNAINVEVSLESVEGLIPVFLH
jgi:hypothetical protein